MPKPSPEPALPSRIEAATPDGPRCDSPEYECISIDDFEQLRWITWYMSGETVSPKEALEIYERNWRHVEQDLLQPHERALIDRLVRTVGKGILLV